MPPLGPGGRCGGRARRRRGSPLAGDPRRSPALAGEGQPGRGRGGRSPAALGAPRAAAALRLPFTTLSVVDNLGSIALGSDISSHREGGTATRCSSRPTAHPDRTGGPDTQRRRRRAANRSAGAPGSGLARKLLPAPRVPPPPPPPSLLLRRHQPRRLAPGCACVLVIYLFSEHASRFFFYSWGRGGGWGGEAHASTHPGTDTGRRAMEPPRAHTVGIKTDHMGRAGGEGGEAGPRMSAPPAAPRLPGGGEAAAAAAAAASPRRLSPGAAGAAAAVDVPPPRSSAILLCLAAPLLLHAQERAAELGGHSPGHNLAFAAAPAAATTAPASASSPSSSPPPPPAPGPPPPRGPPQGPPHVAHRKLIGWGAHPSSLRRWSV